MYDITLINTRHRNDGNCNSIELGKILELIKPDVIFEEIPSSYTDDFLISKGIAKLETEAIGFYLANNKAERVPVDDVIPSEEFFQNHQRLLARVEGLVNVHGSNYRKAVNAHRRNSEIHGFPYLNSDQCISYQAQINDATREALKVINQDSLSEIYRAWHDLHDLREHTMLRNIYKYSQTQQYVSAVFLLGCAHRQSIINKISHYEVSETLKLDWYIYTFDFETH